MCFPASLIQRMLSLYCCLMRSVASVQIFSRTVAAMSSVTARSWGSPEVHTQRNGPKPREKMSLWQRQKEGDYKSSIVRRRDLITFQQRYYKINARLVKSENASPHNVLYIRRVTEFSCSSTVLFYRCSYKTRNTSLYIGLTWTDWKWRIRSECKCWTTDQLSEPLGETHFHSPRRTYQHQPAYWWP